MVRAPCCEKMGLKKGPWTPEEDQVLVNYIQLYGHGNWRALPKLAGLLRCGKSCRLRWTNYLRPDIKRGNFTLEEEDTIIEMHSTLGNRWSTIAAKLPGRTDNEIKNVWHTHLKKRAMMMNPNNYNQQDNTTTTTTTNPTNKRRSASHKKSKTANLTTNQLPKPAPRVLSDSTDQDLPSPGVAPPPPPVSLLRQCSSDDMSSLTTATGDDGGTNNNINNNNAKPEDLSSTEEYYPEEMDESFWSEVLSADNSTSSELGSGGLYPLLSFVGSEGDGGEEEEEAAAALALEHSNVDYGSSMDFWYNLLTDDNKELSELPPI